MTGSRRAGVLLRAGGSRPVIGGMPTEKLAARSRNALSLKPAEGLFFFDRVLGPEPFPPAAFQGVHILVAVSHHLACQTGTRGFIGSGAVDDVFFIFGVIARPVGIFAGSHVGGAFDFELR